MIETVAVLRDARLRRAPQDEAYFYTGLHPEERRSRVAKDGLTDQTNNQRTKKERNSWH
ncbi:MAG: hypothetical protein AAFR11_06485 [Pseudomonadota bacterium]